MDRWNIIDRTPAYLGERDITPLSTELHDVWALRLGHSNFFIKPEPYTLKAYDAASFHQFQENWALARCNYTKHIIRTAENYGITSRVYLFTEEKWKSIEQEWRNNYEAIISTCPDVEELTSLNAIRLPLHATAKIPQIGNDNKFPALGDEDIVGVMSVKRPTDLDPKGERNKKQFLRMGTLRNEFTRLKAGARELISPS